MERVPRIAATALVIAAMLCPVSAHADERIIGLKGQPNFRDIGGYETNDGRKITSGLVYRSGELPKLTDEDVEILHELGIKTVINFLTPGEIEWRGKDRLPDGVREINIPISGEVAGIPDAVNKLVEARKSGDFRGFPPKFNAQVHEELVSGLADVQYGELFKILAETSAPVRASIARKRSLAGRPREIRRSCASGPRTSYLCSGETSNSPQPSRIALYSTRGSRSYMVAARNPSQSSQRCPSFSADVRE